MEEIRDILPRFGFEGRFASARELTSGHINATYLLDFWDGGKLNQYTLQRINTYVFHHPDEVMSNITRVTEHLRRGILGLRGDASRRVLEVVRTLDGGALHEDARGGFWRAYAYISGAFVPEREATEAQMEQAGVAFGQFQRHLADFPAGELYETIPDFHNTPLRFGAFVRAVEEDVAGRAAEAREEIRQVTARHAMMGEIVRLTAEGTLPLRVTHNDAKASNVLLDEKTGEALCVIDLDTVMPGSALYDYGDGLRYGASTAKEDEEDPGRVFLDMGKARAFTHGFIRETAGFLTREELLRLPLGALVITCEQAMRFLTDYLRGDPYYKIDSPRHNLVRTRAQLALLFDMERREKELSEAVRADVSRFS